MFAIITINNQKKSRMITELYMLLTEKKIKFNYMMMIYTKMRNNES